MQRLVILFDAVLFIVFLYVAINIFHVLFMRIMGGKFFWLSNKLTKREKTNEKDKEKSNE